MKFNRACAVILLCVILCLCGCAPTSVRDAVSTEGILAVHMIDVDDAESLFVELPDGETLLIDGGESWNGEDIVAYIRNLGYERIDTVIATHPHSDHIGGLPQIIASFDVGQMYLPDVVHTTKTYEQLLDLLETENVTVKQAKADVVLYDKEYSGVFLAPCSDEYSSLNNYSAVLQLKYKEKTFLFTGDAEKLSEKEMLKRYGKKLKADVLKVCHHGSESSSSEKFLQAVSPEIALISADGPEGKYENPDEEVVKSLEKNGAKVYRTDLHGNLLLKTDGVYWRK